MVPHPNRPNQPNSRRPGPFRSAGAHGNNYAFAMALTAITVAVLIIIVISLGRERHGIAFTHRGAAAELGTKRPEKSSLRAKRSNPGYTRVPPWIASSLAMTMN